MKHTTRALVAVALLLGVYILTVVVAVGMVAGLVVAFSKGLSGPLAGKLLIVVVVVMAGMARGLFARVRQDKEEDPGVPMSRAQQPRLWSEIEGLAAAIGTRTPDELWLVPQANAAVVEHTKWLGLVRGKRQMQIGAPLLMSLTEQQLRSVLAHELGHYGGKHTLLAGVNYRGQIAIERVIGRLGPTTVAGRVFGLYGRLYLAVAQTVSRRQELEADDYSVRQAGRETAAAAMRQIGAVAQAWDHFCEAYLGLGNAINRRPAHVFAGFSTFLHDSTRIEQMADLRANPPEYTKSVYDSHPTPAERIARFEAMPPDGIQDQTGSALGVLDRPDELLGALEAWAYAASELSTASWPELVHQSGAAAMHHDAKLLLESASEHGVVDPNVKSILEALRNGELATFVQPLLRDDAPPEALTQVTGQLLSALLASALIDECGGSFRLDWGGPARLVDRYEQEARLFERAEQAVSSYEGIVRLEEWVQAQAIPLDYAPDSVDGRHPESDLPRILAATAPVAGDGFRFMAVLNVGILLKKPDWRDRLTIGLHSYGNPGKAMLKRVLDKRTVDDLLADPKALVMPWEEIESVTVSKTRSARQPKYVIALSDGSRRTIKTTLSAAHAGNLADVFGYYLGKRWHSS